MDLKNSASLLTSCFRKITSKKGFELFFVECFHPSVLLKVCHYFISNGLWKQHQSFFADDSNTKTGSNILHILFLQIFYENHNTLLLLCVFTVIEVNKKCHSLSKFRKYSLYYLTLPMWRASENVAGFEPPLFAISRHIQTLLRCYSIKSFLHLVQILLPKN